ncbi:MAG: NADH-quinone oxidoreductase subunit C [Polyangiaceae bacterium]|nr:NADH-quinone oxidoreductase subunit C [Polyangiaceae bacterium]MCE7888685.1 hydrogenase [Sorangiineae bacterium PRO1]
MSAKRARNAASVALAEIPRVPFQELAAELTASGARLASLFGAQTGEGLELYAVIAHDDDAELGLVRAPLPDRYPALTLACPEAHWFERELAEQWGVVPVGHPFLKPIRFHRSFRPGHDAWGRDPAEPIVPGDADFYRVAGDEVHEVAVGPVHAGVIEPGHFRLQCHGEQVLHLEISLGYQHRGVERAALGGPHRLTLAQMETIAGDTTVGHTTAYCQALEALARVAVPPRAQVVRAIGLELERLANHTGDLGALAGDVAYQPTAAFCGRLRGDFLNMTALIAGSRFGRGLIRPGGVGFDLDDELVSELRRRLDAAERDVRGAAELLFASAGTQARFEETGVVGKATMRSIGAVGVAARASGLPRDVRHDHPSGAYRFFQLPVATAERGDVYSRAFVRWLEMEDSIDFVRDRLDDLPRARPSAPVTELTPSSLVVSLVEGWRGELCHVALTDERGRLARYKITDPSFHNWFALALALRDQEISDFPLCNKSFNLSYAGHDL